MGWCGSTCKRKLLLRTAALVAVGDLVPGGSHPQRWCQGSARSLLQTKRRTLRLWMARRALQVTGSIVSQGVPAAGLVTICVGLAPPRLRLEMCFQRLDHNYLKHPCGVIAGAHGWVMLATHRPLTQFNLLVLGLRLLLQHNGSHVCQWSERSNSSRASFSGCCTGHGGGIHGSFMGTGEEGAPSSNSTSIKK